MAMLGALAPADHALVGGDLRSQRWPAPGHAAERLKGTKRSVFIAPKSWRCLWKRGTARCIDFIYLAD